MKNPKQQFPFVAQHGILMPYIPIRLIKSNLAFDTRALVDSGAAVNVLPYQLGIDIGGTWNDTTAKIQLTGNLANYTSCPLVLEAIIGNFQPIKLGFAWVKTNNAPVILGQVNFFAEFDICFYRSKQYFEIALKS